MNWEYDDAITADRHAFLNTWRRRWRETRPARDVHAQAVPECGRTAATRMFRCGGAIQIFVDAAVSWDCRRCLSIPRRNPHALLALTNPTVNSTAHQCACCRRGADFPGRECLTMAATTAHLAHSGGGRFRRGSRRRRQSLSHAGGTHGGGPRRHREQDRSGKRSTSICSRRKG
jgi:hypothetical protein